MSEICITNTQHQSLFVLGYRPSFDGLCTCFPNKTTLFKGLIFRGPISPTEFNGRCKYLTSLKVRPESLLPSFHQSLWIMTQAEQKHRKEKTLRCTWSSLRQRFPTVFNKCAPRRSGEQLNMERRWGEGGEQPDVEPGGWQVTRCWGGGGCEHSGESFGRIPLVQTL